MSWEDTSVIFKFCSKQELDGKVGFQKIPVVHYFLGVTLLFDNIGDGNDHPPENPYQSHGIASATLFIN